MKKKSLVKETELPLFEQVQSAKASFSAPKKITTPSQTVKVSALSLVSASASSPYGLCRCGKAISIPGLDGYYCSKCGWIGLFIFLGGRR